MNTHNASPLAVRGTAQVCRELGIAAWAVERLLSAEGYRVQRLGNARAWTEADVAWLRARIVGRAARRGARGRGVAAQVMVDGPEARAVDLAVDQDHEEGKAVRS